MIYLLIVSLVWAFSFGLIKENFSGIDANFVASARLLVSFVTFLPFFRPRNLRNCLTIKLFITGVIQYGLMYLFYFYSFRYLKAYEVALFTILTPLYVTLINDLMKRRFHAINLFTTILAILGTAVVKQAGWMDASILRGFFWVQLSNICFAFGQIYYKESMNRSGNDVRDEQIFAVLYLGGFLICFLSTLIFSDWQSVTLSGSQLLALLYLGSIASGFCFFLWNYGARRVNTGALAIFNNLKIPLAIIVSLVFFHEETNLLNLLLGGGIVLIALFIDEIIKRRTLTSLQ